MTSRKIIHLDLDAFYCAVEAKLNPELAGKAYAVGGRPEQRGVVASCSYPARKKGVRSAMPMGRALRLCPELVVVPGSFREYSAESKEVMAILRDFTPMVEQLSIDEAFLDVSDLPDDAEVIAVQIQSRIRTETGLPCSLGVATNKLVAKIANDVGKSRFEGVGPPNAITVVKPGHEAQFLAPLRARALWGIGPKTEEKLNAIDIQTIGDLAEADPETLKERFGKHGADMAQRARGIDHAAIVTEREAKSFSQEVTFSKDVGAEDVLKEQVNKQSDRVARTLQGRSLLAQTVRIKIRWSDFTTLTRQLTLLHPTDQEARIAEVAWELVLKVWSPGRPVRLIGVGVSGLVDEPAQLPLWEDL
jgi:DNA polymerase-4